MISKNFLFKSKHFFQLKPSYDYALFYFRCQLYLFLILFLFITLETMMKLFFRSIQPQHCVEQVNILNVFYTRNYIWFPFLPSYFNFLEKPEVTMRTLRLFHCYPLMTSLYVNFLLPE